MSILVSLGAALLGALSCGGASAPAATTLLPPPRPGALRAVSDFAMIEDADERAAALFLEASRVIMHPRCTNCHPSGDTPLQGDEGFLHEPPVPRGPDDNGVVGMECTGCHQSRNLELARVPGAPNWHLAPRSMAWVGQSPRAICEQLKDPERNGEKTLAEIAEHTAHDALVAWGWAPGHGRTTPPGDQASFGALVAAWVDAGAACPNEEAGISEPEPEEGP